MKNDQSTGNKVTEKESVTLNEEPQSSEHAPVKSRILNIDSVQSQEFVNYFPTQRLFNDIDDFFLSGGIEAPIETLTDFVHSFIESEDYEEMDELIRANKVYAMMELIRFIPKLYFNYSRINERHHSVLKTYYDNRT